MLSLASFRSAQTTRRSRDSNEPRFISDRLARRRYEINALDRSTGIESEKYALPIRNDYIVEREQDDRCVRERKKARRGGRLPFRGNVVGAFETPARDQR